MLLFFRQLSIFIRIVNGIATIAIKKEMDRSKKYKESAGFTGRHLLFAQI
jgi:hypothetical protein